MLNRTVPAAAEGMPGRPEPRKARHPLNPRAEEALSFFRYATKAEIEAGANPLIFWNVQPTGLTPQDYLADVQRGKAIAEEYLRFVTDAPTYGNLTILSSMLIDMQRFADIGNRGLLVGFGGILAKFSFLGAKAVGIEAVMQLEDEL